jgi:hypothetical protein
MTKQIALRAVPDDIYWKWKREKEDGEYDNWTEFFTNKVGDDYGA